MGDRLNYAREIYATHGVDVDAALAQLNGVAISVHCWQGDDVTGFENKSSLTGGIAVTGHYPGRARNAEELMADLDVALRFIPGKHRVNLHAIYAIAEGEVVPRNQPEPRHFQAWIDYATERGLGLDFNPTPFSHEMAEDGLTLSHPDPAVRRYWVEHCQATRRIADYMGAALNTPCLHNIWIPDGYKNTPVDRMRPRVRLKESLDTLFAVRYDPAHMVDSLESKLFGLGLESYTVGSHEFYMNYAAQNNLLCLLDSGHFHPTEVISDKISSMLLFQPQLALHVSRGVRWDSDHVLAFDDELKAIAQALVTCNALDRVFLGLDYFDASINRVAAWVIGVQNMQKALLYALLTPYKTMAAMQDEGDFTGLMALTESIKSYPFGDVWDAFCAQNQVPVRDEWLAEVRAYDKKTRLRG